MKIWLKGLGAALVGGIVAGTAQAVTSGIMNPSQLKGAAIAGAILTVGAYLTKSPVGVSGASSEPKK